MKTAMRFLEQSGFLNNNILLRIGLLSKEGKTGGKLGLMGPSVPGFDSDIFLLFGSTFT